MNKIEIRRPLFEDIENLNQFFSIVIKDTFAREGLSELLDDIENEIGSKKQFLKNDFDSNGENRYFLIALDHKTIIGTIEYGPSNELINSCTGGALKDVIEVGTVFVHPDYQGKGIGTLLLNVIFLTFVNKGITEFCLDSGYSNAQKVWMRKFGDPDYLLKDYWSKGSHHMIWRRFTKDMSIQMDDRLPFVK